MRSYSPRPAEPNRMIFFGEYFRIICFNYEKFHSNIHLLFAARIFDYFSNIYVAYASINQFEKEIIEGAETRLYEFRDENFFLLTS